MDKVHFSGYATRNDLLCSDGRTIRKDAFKDMDGQEVPLIWMHDHTNPDAVLGHALLENRSDGVYAYCTFNDTKTGNTAKELVKHGDVRSLSIWANNLKQIGKDVIHGKIRELSLVLAGANPGAYIDAVLAHSESGENIEDGLIINYDDPSLVLHHSDDDQDDEPETKEDGEGKNGKDKTIQDVIDTMNEEQQTVLYALLGEASKDDESSDDDIEHSDENDINNEESEGGDEVMKHNVFDNTEEIQQGNTLSHSDEMAIVELAKQSSVGSLRTAMNIYMEENKDTLSHGIFENYGELFPEFKLLKEGEPETIERDQSWISYVLGKIHKSPFSRIRTRYADARIAELKAKGYQNKGDQKTTMAQIKLLGRTFDPQTIYIKDDMHRDDIIDVTDFSVVDYQWKMMRKILNETLALAALVGDNREEGDPDKIHETHVASVWHDDEMYTIHKDVDIAAAKATLQGTNTGANFSDNYIYAEAIIMAALYAREQYKGTGTPDFYCTPHLVNVMLLARDLNGRRIYDSKADLAKALNVAAIHTVEQFEGLERTTEDGDKKKLLGLIVNMNDYQFGSTKGGEITKFEDFDMDFNKQKYMLETRLSGALNKPWAAIALEEPIVESAG